LFPASPSLLARYDRGTATISIPGQPTTELGAIGPWGGDFRSNGVAGLSWQNDDGWFLQLNGPHSQTSGAARPPSDAEPLVAANYWGLLTSKTPRTWHVAGIDPGLCTVRYTDLTPTRAAGAVTCHDLIWLDASSVEHHQPVPGEPPFGVAIEFEATGDGTVPASPGAP
jgi:hypothetical protein